MPLPEFEPATGYLPGGQVHAATIDEIRERFGGTYRRRELLANFEDVVRLLRELGVTEIMIGGSFVTSKQRPGDIDVIYVPPAGADPGTWGSLAPNRRHELKSRSRVDLWKYPSPQPVSGNPFRTQTIESFFSRDRDGIERGLVRLSEIQGGADDQDRAASQDE